MEQSVKDFIGNHPFAAVNAGWIFHGHWVVGSIAQSGHDALQVFAFAGGKYIGQNSRRLRQEGDWKRSCARWRGRPIDKARLLNGV